MIEAEVIQYLSGRLDVPVYAERPQQPDPSYVIVEKTGSGRTNHIDRATMAIQSYAPTLLGAMSLNEDVKAAMEAFAEMPEISRSELNTDYNFTDTRSKQYRYQAVYDVVFFDD